jgi:hypothetical protein
LSRAWNGLLEADRLKAVGLNREDGAKLSSKRRAILEYVLNNALSITYGRALWVNLGTAARFHARCFQKRLHHPEANIKKENEIRKQE